jgi:hypothetical protein
MPLSRLENFLKNAEGNILYVNPSDFDSTDSVENRGNSLTRPFRTIQRALIEAARFSYVPGRNNDRIDRTTILVYPGTHYIDNRPGYSVEEISNQSIFKRFLNNQWTSEGANITEFNDNSNFDIFDEDNDLRKFNSTEGGVILPRGTSIVGLDLRKTKIRPLYVPDPLNDTIEPTGLFRVTGTCYFTAFTIFDADPQRACYKDSTTRKVAPNFSHHKLTCFVYADGVNEVFLNNQPSGLTDLEMYYYKITHAYGETSGRGLANFPAPGGTDFEPSVDEYRIVGDIRPDPIGITSVRSGDGVIPTTTITITTNEPHNLFKDTPVLITGITTNTTSYTGSFLVSDVLSENEFQYIAPESPTIALLLPENFLNGLVIVESDSVSSASPYIFSCTLRSVFGMNGLFGDGNKATGFKSMLTAQFTGISLQKDQNAFLLYDENTGIYNDNLTVSENQKPLYTNSKAIYRPGWESFHMKASNNSIFQCVSVFAIGFARHFVAESGGDMSITNSNSNFGAVSLESSGFRPESFDRDDVGYITHIIPPREPAPRETNVTWLSLDATKIVSTANTERLYIAGYNSSDIIPPFQIDSYKVGAKVGEELYLTIIIGTQESNFKTPVLMQVPSGIGTSSTKTYSVGRTLSGINSVSNSTFELTSDHQLFNGEKIRILSDTGQTPTGIFLDRVYYAYTEGLNPNQVRIAASLNDAASGNPISGISNLGGQLQIVSTVTDKRPGELGHPIQYDSTQQSWYLTGSRVTFFNTIYEGIVGIGTSILGEVTPTTYITRKVDNRGLEERLYKLRYVIPKEFTNARPPSDGFILQESKNIGIGSVSALNFNLTNPTQLRNPKIIKFAQYVTGTVSVTTELPHKLLPKDIVKIIKIRSTNNLNAEDDFGFNGSFEVVSTPNPKTFTYRLSQDPGTFLNNVNQRSTQQQISSLPLVQRQKYKDSIFIYRSQEIKRLIPGTDGQDGVYNLTAICGSIGIGENVGFGLSFKKFNQEIKNLYPQIDRDNVDVDPEPTISFAELSPIGKVTTNEKRNSITRESLNYFLQNNRVGYAVTGAVITGSGNTTVTLFTELDHNFNSIKKLTLINPGSGYNNSVGVTSTIYSAELINPNINGRNATVKVTISDTNTISSVEIVDPGCAYGIGNTMTISAFPAGNPTEFAVVIVDEITNNENNSLDLSGFKDPLYNGTFKIVNIPSTNSINIFNNRGISPSYQRRNDSRLPHIFLGSAGIAVTSFQFTNQTGIVTVTSSDPHGLIPGNSFVLVGSGNTFFNNKFFVQESVGIRTFTFRTGITTLTQNIGNLNNVTLHKVGLSANATALGLGEENLGGRANYIYAGITTTTSNPISRTDTSITLTNPNGFGKGDYVVIASEIIRIASDATINTFAVNRGQFSTFTANYPTNSSVKKITILPMEIRRHSILRASGHTFEYLGFGPGNYSTALPIKQDRLLSNDEVLTSQARELDGGTVVYTGMNDRGEFYNGAKKISGTTGEEEVIDSPLSTFFGDQEDELVRRNSGIFDDMVIKERLTVEGGENQNQTSQFYGPVNFSQKVTSSSEEGFETRDLYIKGVASQSKLFTVGIATPISVAKGGDISYLANPDPGGYIGHVYSDNEWRRWGMISKEKDRDFLTVDQIGIGNSFGIYNFTDALEVNGTLKVRNLYVGGAVTFAGAQAIGNANFDVIDVNKTIVFAGVGTNYTILHQNANSIAQFQNIEVIGTASTFASTLTFGNSFNSTFSGISTINGTLNARNIIVTGAGTSVTSDRIFARDLWTDVLGVTSEAYISSGIITAIRAEYLGGQTNKPLTIRANSGFVTSITGTAATITTLNSTTGTINVLRAADNFFTPQLFANIGIVTTLSGVQQTYTRSNVGLSTVTNQIITDWIGSPLVYANSGIITSITSKWIGGTPTNPLIIGANIGIITSLTGVAATYTSLVASINLVSQGTVISPVGVVTIMSGTQANYSGIVTASRFQSTIATGASPLVVASTTQVTNLNSSLLGGYPSSLTNVINTVPVRNASGFIVGNLQGNSTTTTTATNVVGGSGRVLFNNATNTTTTSANLTFDGTNLTVAGFVESTSDEKLKTNVKTIENGLEKVLSLRGVEYDRVDIDSHQIGVIAQEVEKIIPEVVSTNTETGTKSVAYGNLVGVLIEAIKDLKVEITELKSEIDELKKNK